MYCNGQQILLLQIKLLQSVAHRTEDAVPISSEGHVSLTIHSPVQVGELHR